DVTQRTQQTELQLWNGIYLQNVDIYVRTGSGPAFTACIPGRRVSFDGAWNTAVVLTPQPGAARNGAEDALGEAGKHVVFADRLEVSGRTVRARVPALWFGGPPQKSWAYSVHVSGADWERSFGVVDRIRGQREVNAFTLPVLTIPEAYAFGGAPPGEMHPRVVDVLLPRGADQRAVMRSFTADSYARIPFVGGAEPRALNMTVAAPPAPAPVAEKPAPELKISYIAGNMISLSGSVPGLQPMQFGEVLGADGAPIAKIVVVQVVEGGIIARPVENAEKIHPGARVRFK
ncbi:MAG TPA: glucodextranase DOMON-like domain-containing protein, partial [Longimicrobium sp.]|nr:glucodextranase DOMON-like domain-containing protein [Longimicrobium sp.]